MNARESMSGAEMLGARWHVIAAKAPPPCIPRRAALEDIGTVRVILFSVIGDR
jgi:hypothetical protein